MIIKADKEGKEAIMQLVDAALHLQGIKSLNGINIILASLKDLEEVKVDKENGAKMEKKKEPIK